MKSGVYLLSAGLEFFCAAISIILLIGCLFDPDRKRPANRCLAVILVVHALMNAVDACVWLGCDVPTLRGLMKGLSFLSYVLGCVIFVLFSLLLISCVRECARVPAWIPRCVCALGAVMVLVWAQSLFNDSIYCWDETGACQTGALFPLSQFFGIVSLAFNIALVIAYRRALRAKDAAVMILYSAIPLVSFLFVPLWDVVPVYLASTLSLLLYYMVIHTEHGRRMAEQEARLARQAAELTDSRTAVMLSQIQPHFLYNALTAIAQLCGKDPLRAKETTLCFSEYLRQNLSALTQTEPIPFEKELEHVRTYLAIEQVRFGDDLRVVYDIGATDFLLPPLCLQPLVENAVKHGVGMKEEGGTVTIRARETADGWQIVVADDGVGFDPARVPTDGKTHIGIRNVGERLGLIGAELRVDSGIGRGTRATITIPQREVLP